MPRHKHYALIQKRVQDPESYEVFARKPEGKRLWLEIMDSMWSKSLEYKLEPKQPCAFLWHIETTEYEYPNPSQIVTYHEFASKLEFVQELYDGHEVVALEGKDNDFHIVGFAWVRVHSCRPLTSEQLAVLSDLNIGSFI